MNDNSHNLEDKAALLTRQFMKYQQVLLAYISTIVMDYHKAEDVLQETVVTLIRRAQDYGDTQHFLPLAREIARRQAIALLQKEGKGPRTIPDAVIKALDQAFEEVPHDDQEYSRVLLNCIRKLPELWQRIVRMRYSLAYSIKQIANDLNRSDNTVSVTLNRARARLADCVARSL